MKILEIPLYLALVSLVLGNVLVVGANVYGTYQLSQSGRHWDFWNGYGICPNNLDFAGIISSFDCIFSSIVNTTFQYVPPKVFGYLILVFLGSGSVAMFIGDQSERVPIEPEKA